MTEPFVITTVRDLVDVVTPENRDLLVRDLGTWLDWHLMIREHATGLMTMDASEFLWHDDGKPGIDHIVFRPHREEPKGEST